jgi:hypothetical protein
MEEVCEENLEDAIKSLNREAPASTGTIDETRLPGEHWQHSGAVAQGTYRPQPVGRVEIAAGRRVRSLAFHGVGSPDPEAIPKSCRPLGPDVSEQLRVSARSLGPSGWLERNAVAKARCG